MDRYATLPFTDIAVSEWQPRTRGLEKRPQMTPCEIMCRNMCFTALDRPRSLSMFELGWTGEGPERP